MNRPNPVLIARARRLLAHEGASGGACGTAAGHVFDKLHVHLDPLLGSAGVRALIVRSAQLTRHQFAFIEVAAVDSSSALRSSFLEHDDATAEAAAVALFGTFFTLVGSYIGDRLLTQALLAAWPNIDDAAPVEVPHE